MHGILLWLHILSAATWIGAAVAVLFLAPRMAVTAASGQAFALHWVEMGRKLFTPAAIVALATGIGLVVADSHSFSSAFVSIGFLMVIVGGVLGARVYAPMGRKIAAAHEAGNETSSLYARMRTLGVAELALLAFTVYAMAVRLGA
ncbi:MAG: hypothetical protein OEY55_05190 [Acidimicrobiia bacterium]|nr:hypothetical protein [Acidimicrobiia bacterium]MDH5503925.1 hypothetical protein [Acidimicrobiia bacterium]